MCCIAPASPEQYQQLANAGMQAHQQTVARILEATRAGNVEEVVRRSIRCEMRTMIPQMDANAAARFNNYAFVLYLNDAWVQMFTEMGLNIQCESRIPDEELP